MPATRIAEDYLRILRFFRFHAAYGEGAPDAAGLHACIAARAGLEQLSRERVRMEMLKLLLAPHAVPALAVMAESGPARAGARRRAGSRELRQHGEGRSGGGRAADAVRRLGALGVWIAEDAERLCQRLRLVQCRARAARRDGDGWWRVSPAMGEARRAN